MFHTSLVDWKHRCSQSTGNSLAPVESGGVAVAAIVGGTVGGMVVLLLGVVAGKLGVTLAG